MSRNILRQQQKQFEKYQLNLITALTHQFQIRLASRSSANTTENSFFHSDARKSRLSLRKLGTKEYERFTNFILSKLPSDFTEIVDLLTEFFCIQQFLFYNRYNCLERTKSELDDYVNFAGYVNCECKKFQLQALTEDKFEYFIFIAGLNSPNDSDFQTRP